MENKNNAAFPLPSEHGYSGQDCVGLTKREYAAIHCTEPVPDWFRPTIGKEPRHVLNMAHTFGSASDHPHKQFFKYFQDGEWMAPGLMEGTTEIIPEIPESLKIEVRRHIVKIRKWNNKKNAWQREYDNQRIKQWRYYFADLLLS